MSLKLITFSEIEWAWSNINLIFSSWLSVKSILLGEQIILPLQTL